MSGKVTVECVWCGETKEVWPSRERDRNFCDTECQGAWRSENLTGDDHWGWEGGKITVECDWCGQTKETWPSKADAYDQQFCSDDCHSAWTSEHRTGQNHPRWKGGDVTVECEWCGDTKQVCQAVAKGKDRHFCDYECHGAWCSVHKTGEKNPMWAGGCDGYYGPNWREQRRRARKRDGHRCLRCPMTEKEHINKFGEGLHVHHVRPFRTFRDEGGNVDYEAAHALDNLVTVCRVCHNTWEGIPLDTRGLDLATVTAE